MKHTVWENLFTALILNTIITSASFAQKSHTAQVVFGSSESGTGK